MGWFNSGKKEEEKVTSGSNTLADGVVVSVQDVPATVDKFVAESPLSVYLIDGEREADRSIICRANENGGQTCLNLSINGITLFKTMQGKNYFCSLPPDIGATHFECRKIT